MSARVIDQPRSSHDDIFAAIVEERARQKKLHETNAGSLACGDGMFALVLMEESGEIAKAILEDDIAGYARELVHVATVCVARLERIGLDGRGARLDDVTPT